MQSNPALLFVFIFSFSLWVMGYLYGRKDVEMHLPHFIKFIYGKHRTSLYRHGTLVQTLSFIIAVIYGLKHSGFELIYEAKWLLLILSSILSGAILIDEMLKKRVKEPNSISPAHYTLRNPVVEEMNFIKLNFKVNRVIAMGAIFTIISVFFVIIFIVIHLILTEANQTGKIQNTPLLILILFFLFLIFGSIALFEAWILDIFTIFTDQGIKRKASLFNQNNFIEWSEIKRIDTRRKTLRLYTSTKVIKIHLWLFKNPDDVVLNILKYTQKNGEY